MNRLLLFLLVLPFAAAQEANDWPWWRGSDRNGVARMEADQSMPAKLGEPTWRTAVPGKGHGSVIVAKDRVFLTVAEEKKQVQSVVCLNRADGKKVWQTPVLEGSFKQRLNTKGTWASTTPALIKNQHLYGIMDVGMAVCWDSATGEEKWKGRLGGTFSASPVLAGDKIFGVNETGMFYAYRADPNAFELLSKQKIADQAFSSPVICGGKLYLRVARTIDGKRQEEVVCY